MALHYPNLQLPDGAILFHVGPPKTGTTSLQDGFHHRRRRLAEQGVHYAGSHRRPRAALTDLLKHDGANQWKQLVAEVHAAQADRICISNEDFAKLSAQTVAAIAADLGAERLHVVFTVRALNRLLPSQWQQRVRRGFQTLPFDQWLEVVLADQDRKTPEGAHFWARHDVGDQLRKWGHHLPADRLHLVMNQEDDRSYLFRVFEGLLGLQPETLTVKQTHNTSLSHNAAAMLLHLDEQVSTHGLDKHLYRHTIKRALSRRLRSLPADPEEAPITIPARFVKQVRKLERERLRLIRSSGARVIGNPTWITKVRPKKARRNRDADRVSSWRTAAIAAEVIRQLDGGGATPANQDSNAVDTEAEDD